MGNVQPKAVRLQLETKRDLQVINVADKELLDDTAIIKGGSEADPRL